MLKDFGLDKELEKGDIAPPKDGEGLAISNGSSNRHKFDLGL